MSAGHFHHDDGGGERRLGGAGEEGCHADEDEDVGALGESGEDGDAFAQDCAYGQGGGEDAAGGACPVAQDGGEPFGDGESGGGFVDAAQGLGGFVVACAVGFALVKRADGGEQDADEGGGNQGMAADVFAPFGGGEGGGAEIQGAPEQSAGDAARESAAQYPAEHIVERAAAEA